MGILKYEEFCKNLDIIDRKSSVDLHQAYIDLKVNKIKTELGSGVYAYRAYDFKDHIEALEKGVAFFQIGQGMTDSISQARDHIESANNVLNAAGVENSLKFVFVNKDGEMFNTDITDCYENWSTEIAYLCQPLQANQKETKELLRAFDCLIATAYQATSLENAYNDENGDSMSLKKIEEIRSKLN